MKKAVGIFTVGILVAAVLSVPASAQTTAICDGRVATIVGTPGPDTLVGTDGPDVIAGLQGNDTIDGRGGDDFICGGIGDDTIDGGQGFDVIFGAQGDDLLRAVSDNFNERFDTAGSRMFGGAGDDILVGSSRWDRMQGGIGNDVLIGFEGRDWMRGGPGKDSLSGMGAIDDVNGGPGNDNITAERQDLTNGGLGFDTCVFFGEPTPFANGQEQPLSIPNARSCEVLRN